MHHFTPVNLNAIVPEEYDGMRLDQVLTQLFPDYSRARLQSWIKSGNVLVDNKELKKSDKVYYGQKIVIEAQINADETWQPQPLELNIVYEDADIIVINKPAGLVVHPGAGHREKTLVNALLHYDPALAQVPRAGIVHRLDKDTSGLLVIARNLPAHKYLVEAIQSRRMKREYQAIIIGVLISGGTISEPIGRHPTLRTRMAVVKSGKEAITHYRILQRFRAHTLIQVQLETGRTHQIRVHMAHIHHPIVGDPEYGGRLKLPAGISEELTVALKNFKRQALHAYRLELKHPTTNKVMTWEIPLPEDMEKLLRLLREDKKLS
jgi:23S rRNA pseudouridine1911/1915/1917 synthase